MKTRWFLVPVLASLFYACGNDGTSSNDTDSSAAASSGTISSTTASSAESESAASSGVSSAASSSDTEDDGAISGFKISFTNGNFLVVGTISAETNIDSISSFVMADGVKLTDGSVDVTVTKNYSDYVLTASDLTTLSLTSLGMRLESDEDLCSGDYQVSVSAYVGTSVIADTTSGVPSGCE